MIFAKRFCTTSGMSSASKHKLLYSVSVKKLSKSNFGSAPPGNVSVKQEIIFRECALSVRAFRFALYHPGVGSPFSPDIEPKTYVLQVARFVFGIRLKLELCIDLNSSK